MPTQTVPTLPAEGFVPLSSALQIAGCSKSTLWRWIADGRFPRPYKTGPNSSRFDAGELRAWMVRVREGAK